MAEMMSEKELAEIRALCEAATPGPWRNGADPSHFDSPEVTDDKTFAYYITTDADAAFVAASRSAVPRLLAEVERLRGELTETRVALEAKRTASQTCRGDLHFIALYSIGGFCECQRARLR